MTAFFAKHYNAFRAEKVTLYENVRIYEPNLQENENRSWPIYYHPTFHSFSEFGLHLIGIFIKPFVCCGLTMMSLLDTFLSFVSTLYMLAIEWDWGKSKTAFFSMIYNMCMAIYMAISMILDPFLAIFSIAVRCVSTMANGMCHLIEDNSPPESITPPINESTDISSIEPLGGSFEEIDTSSPTKCNMTDMASFSNKSLSILTENNTWHNIPVF